MYSGLTKVLDKIQKVMVDGSICLDYRGVPECRSFVLQQTSGKSGLFGGESKHVNTYNIHTYILLFVMLVDDIAK